MLLHELTFTRLRGNLQLQFWEECSINGGYHKPAGVTIMRKLDDPSYHLLMTKTGRWGCDDVLMAQAVLFELTREGNQNDPTEV